MAFLLLGASLVSSLVPAPPTPAQPTPGHYITVFGMGSRPLIASRTHTFATITRIQPTPTGDMIVTNDTISWLPATLRIRPLALRPELGVNLTQVETLRWGERLGIHTSAWGPFEITPERYAALMARKADLDSGRITYRAIGGLTRDAPVSNCGQSFTRAAQVGRRYLHPTPFPGVQGTSRLVDRMIRTASPPKVERPELLPAVVDPLAVTHRQPGERIPRSSR